MIIRLVVTLLALATGASALAQGFPAKPVRIVIPFPPGGGVDLLARALAAELGPRLGQSIVVDNRGGGNGVIGVEHVARAGADGHTLLMTVNTTMTINAFLFKSLPYDPVKSFAPITLVAHGAMLVLAHPSVEANDLRELVALAKKAPGKLNYASFGTGTQSQLVFETMKQPESLDIVHISYKGIAPAVTATIAGEVQLVVASPGSVAGGIAATRLKPLAIAAKSRSSLLPNVPTTAEQGYPYALASVWMGVFAPADTPAPIVERLHREITTIARAPEFAAKQIVARGWEVIADSPESLARTMREETTLMAEMVRAAGIKPE